MGGADIGKGALAVTVAHSLKLSEWVVMLSGASAVLGHDFPIFLRFRGGQSLATTMGIFAVLFPKEIVFALGALKLTLALTHKWELSCVVGFTLLVISMGFMGQPPRRLLNMFVLLRARGFRKLIQVWQARRVLTDTFLTSRVSALFFLDNLRGWRVFLSLHEP